MIRVCCGCNTLIGEKEPFWNKTVTHGLCKRCFTRAFEKIKERRRRPDPQDIELNLKYQAKQMSFKKN